MIADEGVGGSSKMRANIAILSAHGRSSFFSPMNHIPKINLDILQPLHYNLFMANEWSYIMLEGRPVRISKRVKAGYECFIATADIKQAARAGGLTVKEITKLMENPLIVKWIAQRVNYVATTEDFGIDELSTFLIRTIRGEEPGINSKGFKNRLEAADKFAKLKNLGSSNDIGTIKFLLKNEDSADGPSAAQSPVGDK